MLTLHTINCNYLWITECTSAAFNLVEIRISICHSFRFCIIKSGGGIFRTFFDGGKMLNYKWNPAWTPNYAGRGQTCQVNLPVLFLSLLLNKNIPKEIDFLTHSHTKMDKIWIVLFYPDSERLLLKESIRKVKWSIWHLY